MLNIYRQALTKSSRALLRQWPSLIVSLLLGLAGIFLIAQVSGLGPAGGLIAGFIFVTLLTIYYQILREAKSARTVKFKDLQFFDGQLFNGVINAAFFIFLPQFLIMHFAQSVGDTFLPLAFNLVLVLGFNSLPESIYLSGLNGLDVFRHSFNFTKNNALLWFLPIALICLPVLLASPAAVTILLADSDVLLPITLVLKSLGSADPFKLIIAIIISHWFMLFRLFLYEELD